MPVKFTKYDNLLSEIDIGDALFKASLILDIKFNSPKLTGTRHKNFIDTSGWVPGTTGSQTGFNQNGDGNLIEYDVNPHGVREPVWSSVNNDTVSDADGGFLNSVYFDIDRTKKYRFSTWVKRKVLGNGTFYLGAYSTPDYLIRCDTWATDSNPYFDYTGDFTNREDEWLLVVGHIHPYGYSGDKLDPESGVYSKDGKKIRNTIRDLAFNSATSGVRMRSYLYNSTLPETYQQWWDPRIDVCDGTEPTIKDLIAGNNKIYYPKIENTVGVIDKINIDEESLHLGVPCVESISEINSYPKPGNSWGTYYAGTLYTTPTTFESITIANNILSVVNPSRTIQTYDVLRPSTAGGGLSTSTYYVFKKVAENQYTLHELIGPHDGSIGKGIYQNLLDDNRVTLNITGFPLQWSCPAHMHGASMYKEIIKNGFNHNGRIHDCIRIINNHKEINEFSYMAYGVTPSVLDGEKVVVSFYTRCLNGVAPTLQMTWWNTSSNTGGKSFNINNEWSKCVVSISSMITGVCNLYFSPLVPGSVIEISEISFNRIGRDNIYQYPNPADYNKISIPLGKIVPNNLTITGSFKSKINLLDEPTSGPIFSIRANDNDYDILQVYFDKDAGALKIKPKTVGVGIFGSDSSSNFTTPAANILKDKVYHYKFTFNDSLNSTIFQIYDEDGVLIMSVSTNGSVSGSYISDIILGDLSENLSLYHIDLSIYDTNDLLTGAIFLKKIKPKMVKNQTAYKIHGKEFTSKVYIGSDIVYSDMISNDAPIKPINTPDLIEDGKLITHLNYTNKSNMAYTSWNNSGTSAIIQNQIKHPSTKNNTFGLNKLTEGDSGSGFRIGLVKPTAGTKYFMRCKAYIDLLDYTEERYAYLREYSTEYTNGVNASYLKRKSDYTLFNKLPNREWIDIISDIITSPEDITNSGICFYLNKAGNKVSLTDVMLAEIAAKVPFIPIGESVGRYNAQFNLMKDVQLDWSQPWSIGYRKIPLGGNDLTSQDGYCMESLGCNSNSVGGGYVWLGKRYEENKLYVSNSGVAPDITHDLYFDHEHWIFLTYSGTTLTMYHISKELGEFIIDQTKTITLPNYYMTQYGYDLCLGGWDNTGVCSAKYRDLLVAKRCLSLDEIRNISKQLIILDKKGKIYLPSNRGI